MGVDSRWGRGVIVALALVAFAAACSGGDDDQPTALVFAPGEVPLPGRQLDGISLDWVRLDAQEGQPRSHLGPTTVVRTDHGVAAISVIDDDHARNLNIPEPREIGTPGPLVDGQESWLTSGYGAGPLAMPSLVTALDPGRSLGVASRDLTPEQMAALASELPRPLPEPGGEGFPGEVVGALQLAWQGLQADVGVHWESYHDEVTVTLSAATAGEQEVLRALLYEAPEDQIDLRTVSSCCARQVMAAPRTRTVRGAEATIATLTPFVVVLILEGDPGLVIASQPPHGGGVARLDDQLVAIAEGVTAGSPAEAEELVQRLATENLDRQAARIRQGEEEIGWEVLAEHHSGELTVSVSTGEDRDLPPLAGPGLCAVRDRANNPSCLRPSPHDRPLRLADTSSEQFFGEVGDEVATVELVFPGGARQAEILELDAPDGLPTRVFLAAFGMDELSTLTEQFERSHEAVAVARNASGLELSRQPLFPPPDWAP